MAAGQRLAPLWRQSHLQCLCAGDVQRNSACAMNDDARCWSTDPWKSIPGEWAQALRCNRESQITRMRWRREVRRSWQRLQLWQNHSKFNFVSPFLADFSKRKNKKTSQKEKQHTKVVNEVKSLAARHHSPCTGRSSRNEKVWCWQVYLWEAPLKRNLPAGINRCWTDTGCATCRAEGTQSSQGPETRKPMRLDHNRCRLLWS